MKAKYSEQEGQDYEQSLKIYRDLKGGIETAFDEGKMEGMMEIAKKMKYKGLPVSDIVDLTGLSERDIDKL